MIADLLSAESLLLAILAVIYGLWYPEIRETLRIEPKQHLEDSAEDRKTVLSVTRTKAVPLAAASLLVAGVFLPDVIEILVDSFQHMKSHEWPAAPKYDAVKTAFVLVTILTALLCVHFSVLSMSLWSLIRKLTP